ncbi:unnamed protein product [Microthlaspi erraticum]|uniref:Uncharacterized protein n=1 Tax=Microthlaspi erraticum TaxID=1685480 RepID=A0A6D2K592_9BRAS|nr:unnamed protein product [Microthlaspi erraticum]
MKRYVSFINSHIGFLDEKFGEALGAISSAWRLEKDPNPSLRRIQGLLRWSLLQAEETSSGNARLVILGGSECEYPREGESNVKVTSVAPRLSALSITSSTGSSSTRPLWYLRENLVIGELDGPSIVPVCVKWSSSCMTWRRSVKT